MGYVRFKGRVKFGVGEWFGIELFDIITKTRHNGTVFGKKYFNCPRNKGLFVKREQIMDVIEPQEIKKVLKQLERDQLRQQRAMAKAQRDRDRVHRQNKAAESLLAVYQQEIYGNVQLALRESNSNDERKKEESVKKHFRRFSRLGHHVTSSPSITLLSDLQAMLKDDDDSLNVADLSTTPEVDEFGGSEDIEYFQELFSNEEDGEFDIKLFGPFERFVSEFEVVMNKGIRIKAMNLSTRQGRAFVLEYGTGENVDLFIQKIDGRNIKKMKEQKVMRLLQSVTFNVEKGYTIALKQCH